MNETTGACEFWKSTKHVLCTLISVKPKLTNSNDQSFVEFYIINFIHEHALREIHHSTLLVKLM